MGTEVTEVKRYLDGREKRFSCRLVRRSPATAGGLRHLVLSFVSGHGLDAFGLHLPEGMLTHGHYWPDRPYNLYHWMAPCGETIAYYFNICDQVEFDGAELRWRDLVLDVLVLPDGTARVLDRDELPENLEPSLQRYIEDAVTQVLARQSELRRQAEEDPDRPPVRHPDCL